MERIKTSLEGQNRAGMIEEWDRRLGGFLSRFAKMPPADQQAVLEEVERLKAEARNDPERLLEKIHVLAALYGSVAEEAGSKGQEKGAVGPLTARLGEIARAFRAFSGLNSQEDQGQVN